MTEPDATNDLESAIVAVYRGPLEQFVSRRDALVKQLRASKDREAADRVKALRKPSRMAWVLDEIAHEDSPSIDRLAAAITEAQNGDDVRTAFESVKEAVRNVAAVGARVALRAEQPIEPNAIVAAVHAVIGHADAFAEFRAGRLIEVPEAGGLDMLAAVTVREQLEKPKSSPLKAPDDEIENANARDEPVVQDLELERAARAGLSRAEVTLAEAIRESEHAAQLVLNARQMLDAAERALLHAQAEVQSRNADFERARADAASAAASMHGAERAVGAARARLAEIATPLEHAVRARARA